MRVGAWPIVALMLALPSLPATGQNLIGSPFATGLYQGTASAVPKTPREPWGFSSCFYQTDPGQSSPSQDSATHNLLPNDIQTPFEATPDPAANPPSAKKLRDLNDFNRNIYYKNKTEFSLESGWLPNNIPFVFDFVVGSAYTTWPLHYTLVPNIASVRWMIDNIWGWGFLRGNTDMTFSGSYTAIPRGAETRYFAFDYGLRQNFVQPDWYIVPYFEARGGVGDINAKQPYGVAYAQGQDLTFTLMMGSGARYNFNPRFSIEAGSTYMHISNFYLSEPRYEDLGINVWGSLIGFNIRIGKEKREIGK